MNDQAVDTFEDVTRRLLTLDGKLILAEKIEGRYGTCWMLHNPDDVERFGRKFIPCGENSRIQKGLGLREVLLPQSKARALEIEATGLPVPRKNVRKPEPYIEHDEYGFPTIMTPIESEPMDYDDYDRCY